MKVLSSYKNKKVKDLPKYLDPSLTLEEMGAGWNKSWIARYEVMLGGYAIATSKLSPNGLSIPIVGHFIDDEIPKLEIDVDKLLRFETLPPNNYDIKIHLHRSLEGNTGVSYKNPISYYIKEVSSKRDELIIGVHDPILASGNTLQAINKNNSYWDRAKQLILEHIGQVNKVLVLSGGGVYKIINQRVDVFPQWNVSKSSHPGTIILKLSRPLEPIELGDLCNLEQQLTEPREIKLKVKAQPLPSTSYILRGPNFSAPIGTTKASISTKYESWDSLLGDATTKDRLLNSIFSGSKASSADLGIDYRTYSNFIHFSSAKERLANFKYKIQLVEYYDLKLDSLSSATSSAIATNKLNYIAKKNKVLASFDGYEDYLYYESSSYESSAYGIFNASTWPKSNSAIPYTLYNSTSSEVTNWLTTQESAALDYDIDNDYNLEKTIPDHIRLDVQNANYLMFVNMMGQHYDTLYNYIDHLTKIHDRSNELDLGISKDIIWDTLKSLGWHGINGYNFEDLWSYKLGTNESGSYQTTDSGSTQTYVVSSSMPTADITKEVWKRTLNNLPYILKTKGTERSIRALTNTYGLPPTVLRVREYGGAPKDMSTNQYVKYEQFNQSLVFSGSNGLKLPWGPLTSSAINHLGIDMVRSINSVEVRFNANKPQDSLIMYNAYGGTLANWQIEMEKHPSSSNASSGYYNHGRLWSYIRYGSTNNDVSSSYTPWAPIFDNDWWNIQFGMTEPDYVRTNLQTFQLDLWKASDHSNGVVNHKYSSSFGATQEHWYPSSVIGNDHTSLIVGAESGAYGPIWKNGASVAAHLTLDGYTGSLQEIRYWSFANDARLSNSAFTNHVLSPLSIESNTYTGSYSELVYRLPLGSDNRTPLLTDGTTISSSHPNQSIVDIFKDGINGEHWNVHSGSAHGFTGTSADWQYEEETYFTVVPEIIGTRAISDKIRIESGSVTGELHRDQSIVSNSIQLASIDSPMLGVYYSPVDDIDIDISHQIGGAKFDDFVGNPRDGYRTRYKELNNIRNHYWSKYNTSPTFDAYLKVLKYFDHSIFQQVESLLPGRAKAYTGLLIKPNLLERPTISKVSESFENRTYGMSDLVANKVSYKFNSETMDLGALSNGTYEGAIPAFNKTYMVYDRDLSQKANSYMANSFDASISGHIAQGSMASQDIPTYDNSVTSRKYTTKTSGTGSGPVQVQDFIPTAIKNQRYGGTKYGSVDGSIGGIINLVNDPTVTGDGLFDSTNAHNIKCAIEVVETNAVILQATDRSIQNRGDLTIR